MLSRRHGIALVVAPLFLTLAGLTGCSASGDDAGGASPVTDKAKTAQTCVKVADSAKSANEVVSKVAHGAITQGEAAALLAPIADDVTALAKQSAGLPISEILQKMSDSVVALQKVSPDSIDDAEAAAVELTASTRSVLVYCTKNGQ